MTEPENSSIRRSKVGEQRNNSKDFLYKRGTTGGQVTPATGGERSGVSCRGGGQSIAPTSFAAFRNPWMLSGSSTTCVAINAISLTLYSFFLPILLPTKRC